VTRLFGAAPLRFASLLATRFWLSDDRRRPKTLRDLVVRRTGTHTAELARSDGPPAVDGSPLGQLPSAAIPDQTIRSVCGFCATGCSLTVHLRDGVPVNVTPTATYPVNLGSACPKGWEVLAPVRSPDRLKTPLRRSDDGTMQAISWDEAVATFVDRMRSVQVRHGAASVAFLSTGQIPTEEMALLGAFAKFEMGVVHGDGNTRQCMATSVAAHKQSYGFDSPPFTYADFEESDVIVLVGSNLCIAHPILWERILRNPHDPQVVVIDPRRTETAVAATVHVAPRPTSDLALLCGVARELIELGAVDDAFVGEHTNGFDDWRAVIEPWTLDRSSAETGVPAEDIARLAELIADGKRVSLWWTMGVNQGHQAVRTAQAIINIALMTGNIGRPGTGANSITGQCNAMGSRLFANTTNLLGGHDFANAEHRAKVARIVGVDQSRIPTSASWAYDEILDGIETGSIRALWIVATNTAHSWIDRLRTQGLLERLEFLVVQDLFGDTLTARFADLVLPAAGWGEKDGTFINAERRIGRTTAVTAPPGESKSDFDIFRLLAEAWGSGPWLDRWTCPEAAFGVLQELSAGQPCDITAINGYDDLDTHGGIQWPARSRDEIDLHERRLFANGQFFHADGRARFMAETPAVPPEVPTDAFPLVLLTGRQSSAQWHTGTRTDRSAVLRSLAPSTTTLQLHPYDALARGITPHDRLMVRSPRGAMTAEAFVTPMVPVGSVFVSMHDADTNVLTRWTVDPISRQPAYKQSCVEVSLV
jgi:anaerobic selenocysteine-containing dehydrogenase